MDSPSLVAARQRGRSDALSFADALRRVEDVERQNRLTETVLDAAPAGDPSPIQDDGGAARMQRLEREIGVLVDYHLAVQASKPWRLAQLARRLLRRRTW